MSVIRQLVHGAGTDSGTLWIWPLAGHAERAVERADQLARAATAVAPRGSEKEPMFVTELAEAAVAWTASIANSAATMAAAFAETPPFPLIVGSLARRRASVQARLTRPLASMRTYVRCSGRHRSYAF